ncbi:MAG: GNAT family N-acetyltransferase [Candidatus Lokiarchaeota archaeon]|nr:GNAT family N-acetyltransferase [Candidatus Lokiarchaeota archaeon]
MSSWEYSLKDGRTVIVRHARPEDAKNLHDGFGSVVEEGKWLPTFRVSASVADWVNWIQRTYRTRDILMLAEVDGEYAGHITLQPEEWMASKHVAKLGIIVLKEYRHIGVGHSLMVSSEYAAKQVGYFKIILSTFHDNEVARALYESVGYRNVGVRKDHFNMEYGFVDEILMEKLLV